MQIKIILNVSILEMHLDGYKIRMGPNDFLYQDLQEKYIPNIQGLTSRQRVDKDIDNGIKAYNVIFNCLLLREYLKNPRRFKR